MTRVAFLCAFFLATVAVADESPETSAHRVLTENEFEFCNEAATRLKSLEGDDWCALRDDATTCPTLGRMCDTPRPTGFSFFSKTSPADAKVGKGDTGGAFSRFSSSLFEGLNLEGLQVLVWAFLGLIFALIAFFIIRSLVGRRSQEQEEPAFVDDALPQPVFDAGLGEVAALLRKARDASAEDVGLALAFLYAAVLRHLEDRQLIEWDPARTNRDYVRSIRGKTPLAKPMAELVREVERVKFGKRAPERSAFERLLETISTQVGAAVVIVFALMTMSACGDPGLEGTAAFNEIAKAQGFELKRWSRPLDTLGPDDPPVLLDAEGLPLTEEVLAAVHDAMFAGGRVIVLNSTTGPFPDWPHLFVVDGDEEPTEEVCEPGVESSEPPEPAPSWEVTATSALELPPDVVGRLPRRKHFLIPETERDEPEVMLEREGLPFALRWRTERGQLVFVADRRIFANGAMAVPANARLAMALLSSFAGPDKVLAVAAMGLSAPAQTPTESLGRAGLWLLMLQALVVLGLVFWSRGAAFGTLRTPSAVRRRVFSEHVQAVGRELERTRGSRVAASMYSTWALDRLRRRFGREVDSHDTEALAKALHRALGDDETSLLRLIESADAIRMRPADLPEIESDLTVVRRLGRILERLQADATPKETRTT